MDWIEAQLDDESIFPQRLGNDNLDFLPNVIPLILEIKTVLRFFHTTFG